MPTQLPPHETLVAAMRSAKWDSADTKRLHMGRLQRALVKFSADNADAFMRAVISEACSSLGADALINLSLDSQAQLVRERGAEAFGDVLPDVVATGALRPDRSDAVNGFLALHQASQSGDLRTIVLAAENLGGESLANVASIACKYLKALSNPGPQKKLEETSKET